MEKISFQFESLSTKILVSFITSVCIMVFYMKYPATGLSPPGNSRWNTLATTLSDSDISPKLFMTGHTSPPHDEKRWLSPKKAGAPLRYFHGKRSRLLKKKIENRRLRVLTEIKIAAHYWLPLNFSGFPQVVGIILVALAGACLTGSLISEGVEFYWALFFTMLWAALPGIWQNASQGTWESWIIGIYALSWSGLNLKYNRSETLYWLAKFLSGVLAGILISLGSEGWILLIGWIFCFPFVCQERKVENYLGFGMVIGIALMTALEIHYLIYQPVASSSFFSYLIEPFKRVLFSGNWGLFFAVEKLGSVLPSKLFAYQGWLVGIILAVLLAFTLLHFSIVRNRLWPLITSALALLLLLTLNQEVAPIWPVMLYSWIMLLAVIISRISQATTSRVFSIVFLLAVIVFFYKSIELTRKVDMEKYTRLRTLTSRWSKSIQIPWFRGLYEADPLRQVLGFVYSQIEPESWLLVNSLAVYDLCFQKGNKKTDIFSHIGHSPSYLYNYHDLSELDAILYQSKLTPVKLRKLLSQEIPVYLLTDEANEDKIKEITDFLKLKSELFLQVGFENYEVYRLTLSGK